MYKIILIFLFFNFCNSENNLNYNNILAFNQNNQCIIFQSCVAHYDFNEITWACVSGNHGIVQGFTIFTQSSNFQDIKSFCDLIKIDCSLCEIYK